MKIFRDLKALPPELTGGAITIGNFDGVHRGHAKLMQRVAELAQAENKPAIAFTFDPHPAELLRPDLAPPPLTWLERKAELLAEFGINALVAFPTSKAMLALSASDFFRSIVVEQLQASAIVEGPNFFFGKGRTGDIQTLRSLCDQDNIQCEIVPPENISGEIVSSSRIRELIQAGDVCRAAQLLTQPFRTMGTVTRGAGRGATIGFPTANLSDLKTMPPGVGVYAGRAFVATETHAAAIHIGPNPTFGENAVKIEVHVIDFQGDLYDSQIEVEFLQKLRDVTPFSSVDELVDQLTKDVAQTRAITAR